MRYASVCSGVEAASLAWECLGWEPAWFSEIEAFPCAVLKTRFPHVPNLGDMTKIEGEKYRGTVDLLVGGTPCQDVSVAGKRKGFAGERSGLAFAYIRLLETMRPRWFVWENVPGVLSSNGGEDFKAFIRNIDEVGYSCAWRVLDAQFTRVDGFPRAVPQRRRRVFVVGHLGADWRYPASVLFEPDCLPRDTPPRRTKRQDAAAGADAGVDPAKWGDGGDRADTLTCTSHNQLMPDKARLQCVLDMRQIEARGDEVSPTLISTDYKGGKAVCFENHGQDSRVKEIEIAPVLSAKSGTGGGNLPLVHECFPINSMIIGKEAKDGDRQTTGIGNAEDPCPTIGTSHHHAVAQNASVRRLLPVECERLMGFPDNWTRIPWKLYQECVRKGWSFESELEKRGKKLKTTVDDCPDSPRYKACGNSMCVNVMRWIGMRIELVERKTKS